jgi:hypothetical protein
MIEPGDIIRDLEHFGTYSHPGSRRILAEAAVMLKRQEEELRELRGLADALRAMVDGRGNDHCGQCIDCSLRDRLKAIGR